MVGFLVQPILVYGLGDYFYGMWQVLNRLVGYISPASGRPAFALKWTLANQRSVASPAQKRRYLGSAVLTWALFVPILAGLGGMLAWFAPYWLSTPEANIGVVRCTTALLAANLIVASLSTVPQSVVEGENLGYKRMGLSTGLVILGGGLVWIAVSLNTGLTGVALAALCATFLSGLLFLQVAHSYVPWFGIAKPSLQVAYQFLALSWWFLLWNLIRNLMMASDVILLGMLQSVESVTAYSLSKYAPETVISVVAIVVMGIAPGLGGIIGSGDLTKAAEVRGEIMALTCLAVSVLGTTILLWNRTFISLWVGAEYYAGPVPSLLMVVVVSQFVLISNDSNVIDLTLHLRQKVLLAAVSVFVSLVLAAYLLSYTQLGVVGLCVGIIAGRLILSVGYPILVGRYLNIPVAVQFKSALWPGCAVLLLFGAASVLDIVAPRQTSNTLMGWVRFLLSVAVTAGSVALLAFYTILSPKQRAKITRRARIIAAPFGSAG